MELQRRWVSRLAKTLAAVSLLLLGAAASIAGSGIEAGPELWIDGPDNVEPGTSRTRPDVAVDNNGRRIHVWNAFGEVSRGDIFLRRFDAQGNPLEVPRLVNTTTDDDQWRANVAAASDGSFLVIFDSNEPLPGGGERDVVRSQAYDADGNTVGTEQLLSADPVPGRLDVRADVAALRTADGTAGGYAVVWASLNSSGTDTSWGLEACLVSSTGVPSPQFQVPSDPAGAQEDPSVTELADGGFLVVWTEASQVWGRRFNAAGGGVGNDFVISTSFVAQKLDTAAAIGWDGQVLVVWRDQEDNAGTNAREIYARLYDADLVPLGPDFRVNTVLDDDQSNPRVADLGPKGFLVFWESQVASGPDTTGSIESRIVTGPNEFGSPQTQFNIWDNGGGQGPMGAHGWYGRASASWRTPTIEIEPGVVQNDDAILGRDIEHCMFCDDFEWFHPGSPGSLWRWSSTAGVVP
jgi:hypothetical protein